MMESIEENGGVIVDPMEEVRKLQSLVKHLELQNQQLRKKQIVTDSENVNGMTAKGQNKGKQHINGRTESENGRVLDDKASAKSEKRGSASLDDVGLINIEDLELDDEASWLYMSPKKSPSDDPAITKWLRKDLEDPRNKELQLARRALAYKLDELAILHPGSDTFSSPDFSNPPFTKNNSFDSRTFTRGKKKLTTYSDADSMPVIESGEYEDDLPHSKPQVHSAPPRVPPMTDIIDVQEMARMQEESLRQSSPCSTPRRFAMSRKWSSSSRNSSTSEAEGLDGLQPLTKENLMKERQLSSNIENSRVYRESCSNSTHSSPPESLHGSNNSLDKPNDSFHQSLPNLAKGYNGVVGQNTRARPLNQVAAINGTQHPLPPRSLALPSRLSSLSPARSGRSMGLPSRSVGNLQQQQQQQQQQNHSLPPRRMVTKSSSPLANGPPQAMVAPVAPTRVKSPSRRVMSPTRRVLSPPSKPRLQAPSSGSQQTQQQMPRSSLPVPRYSKIPSPKPRSGIPVPSSRQQHNNSNPGSDSELWSDGCY